MCNIAGYAGADRAAPILIEMMRRQEGYGGSWYTGLATLHEGKMYWRKVKGNVDTLLQETDALSLPGSVGIIHSRSRSGGDAQWAHPFVDRDEKFAYVANGSAGYYLSSRDVSAVTVQLSAQGERFLSRVEGAIGNYPHLPDGSCIHMSDLMCQLIANKIRSGQEPRAAMAEAFGAYPSEIVGLSIHADFPDQIFAARINQPMCVACGNGATYLATTALAFPENAALMCYIPENTSACITASGMNVDTTPLVPEHVLPITPRIWHDAYDTLTAALQNREPKSVGALVDLCKPLWPEEGLPQGAMLVYEVLRSIRDQGHLQVTEVPAQDPTWNIQTHTSELSWK